MARITKKEMFEEVQLLFGKCAVLRNKDITHNTIDREIQWNFPTCHAGDSAADIKNALNKAREVYADCKRVIDGQEQAINNGSIKLL